MILIQNYMRENSSYGKIMCKFCLIFFLLTPFFCYSQDSIWNLSKCIRYAREENLSVNSSVLDEKLSLITYKSSKLYFLPSLNIYSSYGKSFGRSVDPTSNQFENTKFSYLGVSASSGILLFGWFQKRYEVQSNQLKYKVSQNNLQQLKNDIMLNVCTGYLRVLMARDQMKNIDLQTQLSQENLVRINKLLEAGKSNILELSQAKTQLYNDTSAYQKATLNYEQALLDLKVLLNLDFDFNIFPDSLTISDEFLSEEIMSPQQIYDSALLHLPTILISAYNIEVAEKEIKIANAMRLPQLSLSFSSGTNYSSSFYEIFNNGETRLMSFGKQFTNNLSQSIGLSMNIPIFENFANRNAVNSAKILYEQTNIKDKENRQQLKKDIYNSFYEYKRTLAQFKEAIKALENTTLAFKAATVRYENGFIAYYEYLNEKNNLLSSQNEVVALKYDLYFKKIVLEFFKGSLNIDVL